jgi:hypothetical protein
MEALVIAHATSPPWLVPLKLRHRAKGRLTVLTNGL